MGLTLDGLRESYNGFLSQARAIGDVFEMTNLMNYASGLERANRALLLDEQDAGRSADELFRYCVQKQPSIVTSAARNLIQRLPKELYVVEASVVPTQDMQRHQVRVEVVSYLPPVDAIRAFDSATIPSQINPLTAPQSKGDGDGKYWSVRSMYSHLLNCQIFSNKVELTDVKMRGRNRVKDLDKVLSELGERRFAN